MQIEHTLASIWLCMLVSGLISAWHKRGFVYTSHMEHFFQGVIMFVFFLVIFASTFVPVSILIRS
jgi:hypothetical protein